MRSLFLVFVLLRLFLKSLTNGFFSVQLLVISFITIYLFIIYAIFNVLGGGKESRTPDLLLARQAL